MDPEIFELGFQEVLRESRSPVHLLFAALLFFETAAELSVLQFAALHLILRAGMSPSAAMYFLSFYCLALLGGRFVAQAMLQKFPHRRLLLASAAMSSKACARSPARASTTWRVAASAGRAARSVMLLSNCPAA